MRTVKTGSQYKPGAGPGNKDIKNHYDSRTRRGDYTDRLDPDRGLGYKIRFAANIDFDYNIDFLNFIDFDKNGLDSDNFLVKGNFVFTDRNNFRLTKVDTDNED